MNGLSPWRGTALSLLLPLLLAACAGGNAMRTAETPSDPGTPVPAQDAAAPGADGGAASPAYPAAPDPAAPAASGAVADVAQPTAADAPVPPADAAPGAPTQAEQDYAAIYGDPYGTQQAYDPVADPALPSPVQLPASYDPWEKWNRKVHGFNNVVDRSVAKPLAKAYVKVVPRPVRLGVSNFFNNLGQPVSMVNALLQGRPGHAGDSLMRFLLNTTVGVGGIFDPATRVGMPNRSEDFGQTLGVWGWQRSRYVELPLFGPRTVRDTFGLVGDGPLAPLQHIEEDKARVFLQGLQLVDVRTQLMAVDRMREGAADDYALVRDAWLQRRNYQINGDRRRSDDELPEYLQDDVDPYVPVDVMPVVPGSPGG